MALLSPVHGSPHPLGFHTHITNSTWHAIYRKVTYQYKNELVPEECQDLKCQDFEANTFFSQMPLSFAATRRMEQSV